MAATSKAAAWAGVPDEFLPPRRQLWSLAGLWTRAFGTPIARRPDLLGAVWRTGMVIVMRAFLGAFRAHRCVAASPSGALLTMEPGDPSARRRLWGSGAGRLAVMLLALVTLAEAFFFVSTPAGVAALGVLLAGLVTVAIELVTRLRRVGTASLHDEAAGIADTYPGEPVMIVQGYATWPLRSGKGGELAGRLLDHPASGHVHLVTQAATDDLETLYRSRFGFRTCPGRPTGSRALWRPAAPAS
jgi:hypothetical protein